MKKTMNNKHSVHVIVTVQQNTINAYYYINQFCFILQNIFLNPSKSHSFSFVLTLSKVFSEMYSFTVEFVLFLAERRKLRSGKFVLVSTSFVSFE